MNEKNLRVPGKRKGRKIADGNNKTMRGSKERGEYQNKREKMRCEEMT